MRFALRGLRLIAAVAVALCVAAGAAAAPPPTADEVRIGKQLAAQIEKRYKVVTDPAVTERITRIGETVAAVSDRPGVTYVFKVLDVDVINALSLPGGFIYFTKPMLGFLRSDHEVAAVMAHEIAHVAHAHAMEMRRRSNQALLLTVLIAALTRNAQAAQGAQLASIGVLAHYSRDLERDADVTAITYMQKTAYVPVAVLTVMERIVREEHFRAGTDPGAYANHPTSAERVTYIEAELRRRSIPLIRRIAANYLRLTVRQVQSPQGDGAELLVNDTAVLRLPDAARVQAVAERLDRLFNADLRSFEVGVRQQGEVWILTARGGVVVTVTPEDALWNGTTARELAFSAHARLRAVIEEDLRRRKLSG